MAYKTRSLVVIVGCALGYLNIMDVAFAQAGASDPAENRTMLQVNYCCRTNVSHAASESADELMQCQPNRTSCWYLGLNTLGNQLVQLDI